MLKIKAPAKVNLFLWAKHKRTDGYHELETLFERTSLADEISFERAPAICLKTSGRPVVSGKDNLVYRAASLLKETHRVKAGVRIRLKKNIPVAAGLGGGSSDAASTLLGLNRFWKLKLTRKRLLAYAAELGSDVAFFILNTPFALGKGRGEKLKVLKSPLKIWHVLLTPRMHVLTKDVYGAMTPDLLTGPKHDVRILSKLIQKKHFGALKGLLFNNLERVVLSKYTQLKEIKEAFLRAGAEASLLSGSGPTVFGLASSKAKAQRIALAMKKRYPTANIAVASTY